MESYKEFSEEISFGDFEIKVRFISVGENRTCAIHLRNVYTNERITLDSYEVFAQLMKFLDGEIPCDNFVDQPLEFPSRQLIVNKYNDEGTFNVEYYWERIKVDWNAVVGLQVAETMVNCWMKKEDIVDIYKNYSN